MITIINSIPTSRSSKRSFTNNTSENGEGRLKIRRIQTSHFPKNKKRQTISEILFEKLQNCMISFMQTQNEAKKQCFDNII